MVDTVLIRLIRYVVGIKMDKCCNDYYCGFPAWTGTSCIFCGKSCKGCEVGERLMRDSHIKGKKEE